MNRVQIFKSLAVQCRRMTTQGGETQKLPPPPERLRRLQEHFQVDNGVPVHLKGGPMDRFLYYTTLGLCILALAGTLNTVYVLSFPKKPE